MIATPSSPSADLREPLGFLSKLGAGVACFFFFFFWGGGGVVELGGLLFFCWVLEFGGLFLDGF